MPRRGRPPGRPDDGDRRAVIVHLRRAAPADADAVTRVLLHSGEDAPSVVRTPVQVRRWVAEEPVPGCWTWVALVEGRVVGLVAVADGWLEQHHVVPEARGHGVGRALLDVAKEHSSGRLQVHVYQRDAGAQRFYAAAGFVVTAAGNGVGEGDDGGDDEGEPALVMSWRRA